MIYATLEPRYRLADQVPDREQAVEASGRLDAKLTGANPIDVLIEFPQGASLYAPETLADDRRRARDRREAGRRRQRLVAGDAAALAAPRRPASPTSPRSSNMSTSLPEHLTRRFISAEQDAVVVTGRIPDIDASQLLPVVDSARQGARRGARGSIPATRSRSPASRPSRRATAPT